MNLSSPDLREGEEPKSRTEHPRLTACYMVADRYAWRPFNHLTQAAGRRERDRAGCPPNRTRIC